jgi:hypothetical protein
LGSLAGRGLKNLNHVSFFNQAGYNPVLGFRNWLAFGNLDSVTHLVLTLFIMGVVLAGFTNDFAVQLVLDARPKP